VTIKSPEVAYAGRLLFLNWLAHSERLFQLTSASVTPVQVGTFPDLVQSSVLISADGLVSSDELALPGASVAVQLPDGSGGVTSASFSPDGGQLAYTTGGRDGQLVVYDVATRTAKVEEQEPCAGYVGQTEGATPGAVCGQIDSVVWLDPTTLLVQNYTQAVGFPEQLPEGLTSLPPNSYSTIDLTTGTEASVPILDPEGATFVTVRGNTLLLEDGAWLDLSQAGSGTGTENQLPSGVEACSLAPDGSQIVVAGPNGTWRLLNIHTGATRKLDIQGSIVDSDHQEYSEDRDDFVWSPDGQSFAVVDRQNDVVVVPISSGTSGIVGTIPTNSQFIGWASSSSGTGPDNYYSCYAGPDANAAGA
jgi:WD40 repeat protein